MTRTVGEKNESPVASMTLAHHEGATRHRGVYGFIMPSLGKDATASAASPRLAARGNKMFSYSKEMLENHNQCFEIIRYNHDKYSKITLNLKSYFGHMRRSHLAASNSILYGWIFANENGLSTWNSEPAYCERVSSRTDRCTDGTSRWLVTQKFQVKESAGADMQNCELRRFQITDEGLYDRLRRAWTTQR
ncbi:hypothetical protein FB451DRAFT_1172239 [Mycena latifolia]|nr:hypothetical protein FB451DRAFT_1172239 [Mycena latifolia]